MIHRLPLLLALASTAAFAIAPIATTTAATSVTSTSAFLNGSGNPGSEATTGWFRLSTVSPGSCNDTFGTRVPSTSGTALGSGAAAVVYSVSATGLLPGNTYFFCAITNNPSGTGLGALLTFSTPPVIPSVATAAATFVTSSAATFNGSADPNGSPTTGFFRFSTTDPGVCNNSFGTRQPIGTGGTALGGSNGSVAFTDTVSGLLAGTTYYYCAIATNTPGVGLGNRLSFTTLVAAPLVTTDPASGVAGTTATLNGTVNPNGATTSAWFRYAPSNPGSCSDVFGTRFPSSGGSSLSGSFATTYAQGVSGLTPGTTYFYCSIAQNSQGTTLGSVLTFTTPDVPTVTTTAVTSLLPTSATLNGTGTPNGATATGWARYSSVNPGTCNDSFGTRLPAFSGGNNLGAGAAPVAITQATGLALSPGTTYFYCALASNSVGTGFGSLLSFTTPPAAPFVTTNGVTSISGTIATLNGLSTPRGDATTGWFRYSTVNPTTCNDTFGTRAPAAGGSSLGSSNSNIAYLENLTGLTVGTTYYYCAIASNSVGTSFGGVGSFTTHDVPVVITSTPSGVGGTFATLNGSGDPNLGPTTGYFRYSLTNPGTCDDTFGTRAPASSGTGLGTGTTQVGYSQGIGGLTPGATYFYCAIASNPVGTGFGSVISFFTPAAPSMTTLTASPLAPFTATLNGSGNPNNATTTGWFRYSATNPIVCDDFFGTRAPTSGGLNLLAGAAPVTYLQAISGLTPGTTYYFCAIGTNSVGTSFGSPVTFTTPPTLPVVSTGSASLLTGPTATLNASTNPGGATATGWFRYSPVNPTTCNDSFGTRAPVSGGTVLGSGNNSIAFSEPLTGLVPGTTYYYCALSSNSVGTGLGSVQSFLAPNTPTVTTTTVSSLTGTTVTFNGTGNPNGASTIGWFRYSLTNPGSCDDTFGTRAPSSSGTGLGSSTSAVAYQQSVGGLTPGATYFYCALASNVMGTGFGSVLTFTTPATPTVTTDPATLVTANTATLNGTANPNLASAIGWFRYAPTSPGTCNDTFGTRIPVTAGTGTGLGAVGTPVTYALAISGLLPGTQYFVCAIASNSVGTGYGAVSTFTTPPLAPSVVTNSATSITSGTATLQGTTTPRGAATTGWFRYDTVSPGTCNDSFGFRVPFAGGTALGAGNNGIVYTEPLTGLSLATTYYFCAISQNSVGLGFGAVTSFTTLAAPPSVTTLAATGITTIAAAMNASATPNGAAATGWFRYSTTNPVTCNDSFGSRAPASGGTALGGGTSPVPFSVTPATLITGATYYFCAIAQNSAGTGFGAVLTFQTTTTPPTLNTLAATSIGGSTATLNGSSTPNGATTSAWFRYANASPGSCNDTFGTRTPASGGTDLGAGVTAMPFSQALTGLTPGATYYFCAIASNSNGTVFGLVLSFATPAAPTMVTNAASPVTATSATLNATGTPNGTAATGWFRYSSTDPGACDDAFGTRMPASGGQALGSAATPFNYAQALSGLQPGTAYFYCAIGSNAVGTSLGALLSFTTPPAAPSVAAAAATAIGSTIATFNASANPNGASTTGYFRYAISSPGTCNDTFGIRSPASGGSALGSGGTAVPYSQAVTGLLPGTTYYYCPLASNSVSTAFGGVLSFTTTAAPTVITSAASTIASTTATLNGSANPNRDDTTGWFRYATTNPGTCDDTFGTRFPATGGSPLSNGSSSLAYSQNVTGLMQGTVYFFCAIASNSVATSVGTVMTFTTTNAPTPVTTAATLVTGTTATLNGSTNPNGSSATGFFRYAATDPGACTASFGTRAPASSGTALGAGTSPIAHNQAITGLVAGTTYWYCAQGTNAAGTGLGNLLTFTTPGAPTVVTTPVTAITTTTATLEGAANPNLGTATGWFRYATTNPVTCNDTFGVRTPASGGTALGAGSTPVAYTQAITGLAQGTTYYACAIASNTLGTRFGAVQTFVTSSAPVVTTSAATLVDSTSATLNGSANPRSSATDGWFRYSTTSPGTCNDTFGTRAPIAGGTALGTGSTAAPYLEALTGLTPGTTYYFCAIASNANGTSVGSVLSFTTTDLPVVITTAATALGGTTATLNGSGDPNGATATGYFRYSTTNPGTCNDTFGTRSPASGGTNLGSGTAAIAYSSAISGLTSLTTYFYCAIVSNAVGTTLGSVLTFTTPSAPVVTTVAASTITSTGATLNGSGNPNGLTATGWFRYALTDPGTCNDTFGTRAPSGAIALGAGSTAVAYGQAVTGLTSGATYFFCAIASNTAGTSFGAVMSFTTPGLPVVNTQAATAITSAAASLNGDANPAGSATTGYFRYATVNPVTCNTTFGARAPVSGGTSLGAGFTVTTFTEPLTGLSAATTYYYCAIATNGVGTRLGTVMSFTTAAGPAVATSPASAITGTTATLNGSASPRGLAATGWYRYASVNPGSCNDTFGTRMPASGGTALGSGTSPVGFTENLTGLTPGTTYYFCALASNSAGTSNGAVEVFTTPGPPSVTTTAATGVTSSAATLNGSVTANTAATTGWFRYSTTNPGSCDDVFGTRSPAAGGTALGTAITPITYAQAISGLAAGTTYFFCAIAQNSFGTRYGSVLTFATPAPPIVTTLAANGVAGTSATLNGTANPNASVTTGWFRYATTNPTTCNDTFGTRTPTSGGVALGSGTTPAPYSATLTGLTPGATYWFCALASNTIGTAFGTPQSFTAPAAGPVVVTNAASAVTGMSATLNGSGNPGGASTSGWFRYDATNPGSCNDTFGIRAPTTSGAALGSGNAAVSFNTAITGLMAGTTYYFCAIAQNSAATSFGSVQTFQTPGAPTVTTLAATSITGTTVTLPASANPGGGVSTGWFRYSATDPVTCNDTFGTRAPTTGGTALGGGFTVTNFSQNVTGLTPGTDYFYCALASNLVGQVVGAVMRFHTPAAPTVMTSSATNVMGGLATLNGGANPNGATATGWFRYSPFDPGTCNDSFGTRSPASGGTALGAGMSTQSFTQNIGGLAPGLTYYFCAISSNLVGVAFGQVLSFNVEAPLPIVRTDPATDLTTREATLNGAANPAGTAATGWFRYSTTMPMSCDDTFGTRVPAAGGVALGMGTTEAPWSVAITGLKPGVTYWVCALASNMGGGSFGQVVSFKTASTTPTVRTAASVVSEDGTATLNGAANSNGMPGKAWFLIGRERPIVCTAAFGEKVPPDGLPLGDSEAEVPFTHPIPGAGGTFYYCAVAETAGGIAFGEVQTFTVAEMKAPGCGCTTGAESASVLMLGLAMLLRARRRNR